MTDTTLDFYEADVASTFLQENLKAFCEHVEDFGWNGDEAKQLARTTIEKLRLQAVENAR